MEKEIDLSRSGHARSPFTRKLVYTGSDGDIDFYRAESSGSLRTTWDPKDKTIVAIDFDGGPYLTEGSVIYQYKVASIIGTIDDNIKDVKIALKKCSS